MAAEIKANKKMDIKLIVVRTADIKVLADFYSNFGLTFDYHRHGDSPFHYSATIGQTVFEIYPLAKSQTSSDKNLRLGFSVDNFENVIRNLNAIGVNLSFDPIQTDFGYMTVIEDPDGRKIELYKK